MAKLRFIEVPSPSRGNGLRYEDVLVKFINDVRTELHELDLRTWREYGHDVGDIKAETIHCLSKAWSKNAHATLLCVDGKPAAFAMTSIDGKFVAFWNFMVAKEFRSQGYGKALMDHLIERSRKRGCTELCLNVHAYNEVALNMYREAGFKPKSHLLSLHL